MVAVPSRSERETVGDVEVVRIDGELDQASIQVVRDSLDEAIGATPGAVLVDLSGCEFIDSSGLSLIVEACRRLEADGAAFAICSPREEVRRLLELTGIGAAVPVHDSRDAAMAAFAAAR